MNGHAGAGELERSVEKLTVNDENQVVSSDIFVTVSFYFNTLKLRWTSR